MKKTIKEIISVFVFKLIIAAVTFIASIFISRTLGSELQGKYSLIILFVILVFNLGNMGIGVAANYFSARKSYHPPVILSNFLYLSTAISSCLFLVGILIRIGAREIFLPDIPDWTIYLALLSIPIRMIQLVLEEFLLGLKEYRFYNFVFFTKIFLKLLLTIVFYFTIKNLLFGYVLAYVLSQLLAFPILINKINKITPALSFKFINYSIIKKIFRFGILNHFNNLVVLLEFKIDIFLINFFSGPLSVGYYYISVVVSEMSSIFSSAINLVLFPKIAGLNNDKEIKKIKNFGIISSLFFSLCFALLIFFFASPFIKIFFGQAFLPGVATLKIMAFVTFFSNIKKVILSTLSAQNLIYLANPINVFTLILNILLNIFMIPRYGIVGAAYSSLISYSLSVVALLLRSKIYFQNRRV